MKRTLIALGLAAGLTMLLSGSKAAYADDFGKGFHREGPKATARIAVSGTIHDGGRIVTVGYRDHDRYNRYDRYERRDRHYRHDHGRRHYARSYGRQHLGHDCWCGHSHEVRRHTRYHRHAHRDRDCGDHYSFEFRW